MSWVDRLKYNWNVNSSAIRRLIILNSGFFLLAVILRLFFHIAGYPPIENSYVTNPVLEKGVLYSGFDSLLWRPWSIFTYMFMHNGVMHVLFNMILLFFIGRIAEDFYDKRDIYLQYFIGGITGALLFMIAFNTLPLFTKLGISTPMVGASAAVISILVATAAYVPDYEVFLWGIWRVKLKWLAIAMIGLDIVMFTNGNEGGRIAHLGGAAFGWFYALNRHKFPNVFRVPAFIKRKSKLDERKIYRNENPVRKSSPRQEEIDAILDKISHSGYNSLSRDEKETLFRASEKDPT